MRSGRVPDAVPCACVDLNATGDSFTDREKRVKTLLTTTTATGRVLLTPRDIRQAQQAFSTRRVPVEAMRILLTERSQRPVAGQLVLARVVSIGQHTRVELANGRRAQLYIGGNVILAYGNRYAPDQFEGMVPPTWRHVGCSPPVAWRGWS